MSKQVKWRRGTTEEHSTFIGAVGEVTVDTTKDTLVVHDGVTLGGHSIPEPRDWQGFTKELFAQAGIVPNGQPDKLGASQRVDAIKLLEKEASKVSNANGGNVQNFIDAQYTAVAELETGKYRVGAYVRLTDRAMGLFLLQSGGTANGYDIIDAGNGNTARMVDDIAVRSNSLSWGFKPSDILPTINQTSTLNAMISDAKAKKYKMFVAAGNYLVDKINLVDFNVGGFVGAGMEKTTFWQAIDLIDEPFVNCGTEGDSFSPTDSDVQFAKIGGFTIRSNNKVTWRGTSWNFFRRGKVFSIKAVGYLTGHYYNYSWLDKFSGMYSENHTSTGHHFGSASLNAINAEGFVSSSSNPFVRDYNYDNPNTLLLSCMGSEGTGNGHYFNDGRSVTLLNSHHEGVNTRMRTTATSTNGLCVNIVGGASFNAPKYFAMPNITLALTVTNFTLYDVGADFSGVLWAINAKTVVINNLNVVDSNKNKATRRQIRTWLINSLGLNVGFCSLDGEILRMNGINAFYDETDKYFNVTTTPGTPVDIPTFSDLARSQITITLVQRLSSTQIASVIINAVITDTGVISQSEVSQINNGTANMVLGYNATTKKLTLDSTFAVTTKVIIEGFRV